VKEITIDEVVRFQDDFLCDFCPVKEKCLDINHCPTYTLRILEPGEVAVKTITIALIISLLETYPDDADEADIALAKQAVAELKTLLGGPR